MDEEKNSKGFTRRNFIVGSAIGAAGLTSMGYLAGCSPKQAQPPLNNGAAPGTSGAKKWSWETPPNPISANDIKNQQNADIVIIGDGLSGLCAAIAAKEAGANPVIIEKNNSWAGRGGHITGFGTKTQASMGIKINYRQIIREWILWAQGRVKEDLLWLFAHKSGASLDWVIDMAKAKGLAVAMWDGYYKGPDYTEYPTTHFFYKPGAGGDFRYENGVAVGLGNDVLLPALEETAKEKGIQIFYNTPAVQLVKDGNGAVTGVIGGAQGNYTQFNAAKGVIICSGDYASNREMVERYDPFALNADAQIYLPNKCNTGEGHIMALHAGGAMQKVEPHAAVIHLEAGAASYGFLHVNGMGMRYKNEDVNTQSKSTTKAYEKGNIAWSVYDADGLTEVRDQVNRGIAGGLFYGQTFQQMGKGFDLAQEEKTLEDHIKSGKVVTANTIEELAAKMNVPVETFVETVRRYNELAASKNDVDFGKRAELMLPIAKPPFYAGKLLSTLLTVVGGLRTNTSCQVLDAEDNPIPNLYVAGAAAGDFFANDYPTICPGIGHGRCITFGRLAGIIAAGQSIDIVPDLKV